MDRDRWNNTLEHIFFDPPVMLPPLGLARQDPQQKADPQCGHDNRY